MRIFVAGATGVIGRRLVPRLAADGHVVAGMTRSSSGAEWLQSVGAAPVVCDVYDREKAIAAVVDFAPDILMHQLTDLPDDGVVLRYGQLYGPGTFYPDAPPGHPRVHVDEAARITATLLDAPSGIVTVVDPA